MTRSTNNLALILMKNLIKHLVCWIGEYCLLVRKWNQMFMKHELHQKYTVYNLIFVIDVCALFAEEIYTRYCTRTFQELKEKKRRKQEFFFYVTSCFLKRSPYIIYKKMQLFRNILNSFVTSVLILKYKLNI